MFDRSVVARSFASSGRPIFPGDAVDEREPVQEDARGERSEDEVLERRLGRLGLALEVARQDVGGQGHRLERDVDRDQVVARRHEEHADAGKEQQRVVLPSRVRRLADEAHRREDRQKDREQDQALEKEREVVDDEGAAQDRGRPLGAPRHEDDENPRDRDRDRSEKAQELLPRLVHEHRHDEHQQARRREKELRREQDPVRRLRGKRHGRAAPAAPGPAAFSASAGASAVAPPTIATIFSEGFRRTSNMGFG